MIAIVSNDAGGAEILSSYVQNFNDSNIKYIFILTGPARSIFKKKIKKINITNLKEAVNIASELICSTSLNSKIELKAIRKFKEIGKKTTVILDHWINYKKRFIYKNKIILTDNICVYDKYAKNLLKNIFPKILIFLKRNYYIYNIKKNIKRKINKQAKIINILYVSEPISEIKKNFKITGEFKTFNFFYKNIKSITKKNFKIIFRIHPAEKKNKYKWLKVNFPFVKFSKNKFLKNDIEKSDIVVGRQTMALVVALAARRKVISCIPQNEKRCILPFSGIQELRDMI